ncbi:FliH/SctL family protein [Actinokineospora auranticolor]|uniref:Flagellar assembly protein FliH n=1 Tax=Actinokineospora auranticolor TaxID=155976 RepID=A0A2S6GML2_9PSEU|nr:FliH/SctL family protein [Actinokineospora auranticolor]PPK66479.1 flagellar assembly protein FliH [Actinokineospora auranticolor]
MSLSPDHVGTVLRGDSSLDAVTPFRLGGGEQASARATAHAEGYATGWAQGMREARTATSAARARAQAELDRLLAMRTEQAGAALTAVDTAARQVQATSVRRAEDLAEQVLVAAIDLAEAMLGAQLATAVADSARAGLTRAIAELPTTTSVVVRVNPADHVELTSGADPVPGRSVTLVADPGVARGDAIAQTAVTTVDATLSGALARVRAELAS